MAVTVEALCFFLHAVSRLSCRPSDERLREMVLDASVRQTAQTVAEMLRKWSKELDSLSLESDLLSLISTRESEYGAAGKLLSEKFNDNDSAIWLAAFQIAESANIPSRDIRVVAIMNALAESLTNMDLANRIGRVEACL